MSESSNKKAKQRKNLLKIVEKFYRKDLEDVCTKFYLSKTGSKQVLKQRVIESIESDKQDIDFDKLRKEIKRVYKSNDKIKKSPKKVKSAKKKKKNYNKPTAPEDQPEDQPEDKRQKLEPIPQFIDDYYYSSDSDDGSPEKSPVLKTLEFNFNFNQRFQPTVTSADNNCQPLISPPNVSQTEQTSSAQPFNASGVSTSMTFPVLTARPPDEVQQPRPPTPAPMFRPMAPIFTNLNPSLRNPFAFTSGPSVRPSVQPQQANTDNKSVANPQLLQPLTNNNPLNGCTQPINYSINNYFQNSTHSYYQQNFFQSPIPDILSSTPENIDCFVEQQKFLLSQYPKSFQDSNTSTESEANVTELGFKCLPKYKTLKQLKPIKTIGSLSDIGTEVEFNISISDLEPNYFEKNYLNYENLKSLLDRKALKVQLRFSYVENIKIKEQKDSIPEHLCIECNNKRIFTYEENCDNISGPFDLSDVCCYNTNKVRFWMSKPNYTFLLPCIYEISIVEFETSDSLVLKLKQNLLQFLSSESTKQIIKSRSEQSNDDIININTEFKLTLTCPLSCRRIETPIRSVDCKHIECFDANSFFRTNEKRYDWFCPICQKSAQFDRLRIDGFVAEILYSTDTTTTEIFIKPDATYDTIQSQKETVIVLDDSDSEIECSVIDSDGCIVLD